MVPLLVTESHWSCPNCPATHVTAIADPHAPYHQCPGLKGILAPYVLDGTRCKVEAVERGDYAGTERGLCYDADRRLIMSVVTTRDDGQDCAVFAPVATASQEN